MPALAIVNAIPFREEAMSLEELDVYGLLSESDDGDTPRGDRVPYNPAVLEALQNGTIGVQ